MRVETYPNGGASVIHMYQDEIQNLSSNEIQDLANEFFKVYIFINQICALLFLLIELKKAFSC